MKYILCVDWGPGGSNPYDLALGGGILHIPFTLPFLQPCQGPSVKTESSVKKESSAHSEAEIRESVREFQSLIVWEKKLDL